MDWWRDQLVAKVNQLNQVYIRQGHPPHLFLGGLYGYIVWVTLHQVLPTRFIIWGFGTVWLTCDQWQLTPTLHSYLFPSSDRRPSMVQRALEYQQQFMIHSLDKHTTTTSDPLNFVIYENQRRSPLTGTWHAITLPLERTAWTDDAQATVLPTHQFVLPSPVQLEQAGSEKWVWAWVWVDSDWQHGEWEYGDLVWTLTGQDDGLTRQRKWTRRAILECTVILPQQQKKPKPLVIDSPSHNPSLSSPRPSVISPTESFYRPPLDFSSSQASLLSTKTDDLSLHPSSRDPKRSSSRSTRRQVVWKSIVKT
ncbi:hypothetical protein BC941DRAFT_456623 [Chlamydoabsidia padenii]|nr:hypothetical protein BC941DRAFT_456623 [Chlamydoabsidia padenii]